MVLPSRYKPTGTEFSNGGMSVAKVCKDEHLERLVLIKHLQAGIDQSRLLDEIAALTAIRSKHVVEIFDVLRNDNDEIIGIVEDYLPGVDLDSKLPINNAAEFIRTAYAIACGISDIHERGRVHRDIKPSNMKYDAEACLKIFDFGLSRPDDLDAKTIGTVGTPGYLAPELCVKDDEEVSFSQPVDVFAFGATATKMLLGKLPADMRKIPPVLPSSDVDFVSHPLGLPEPIAEILIACLSPDPASRPTMPTVRDVLAAHLLQGKHRATLVLSNTVHTLDVKNPVANIGAGSLGSIQIQYDGMCFRVTALTGNVTINNLSVALDQVISGSCVITLGDPSFGWHRKYVTFDVSHPEVVL